MTGLPPGDMREVRILGFPVAVQARAQEHLDDLMREFMLIAAGSEQDIVTHVPRRLLDLIAEVQQDYAASTVDQEARLDEARQSGVENLDLCYKVPVAAASAATRLAEALDAADAYCLSGEHLLTLATPPDALQLRRWYLGQFVEQLAGASPTPWPDWMSHSRRQ